MTIAEAMLAVNDEYNEECRRAQQEHPFNLLMVHAINSEYAEIDQELPSYVSDIAHAMGVPSGTIVEPWIYQLARMAFRMGMRTQRKLERPEERSSLFWRSDQEVS